MTTGSSRGGNTNTINTININNDHNTSIMTGRSPFHGRNNSNNNSNNSNNNNAASSYNHHFNIDQTTPHWSTVSSAEGDLDGNDVVDNRDATNSFGVGAYTTSKEECVSLSTSGTCSPPEDGQYAGSRYAYGNVVESREPLGRTKNVHTTISGSSSSDNVRTTRRVAGRRE
uniref:Uncharacterized protein n=1 Tax=Leptocylindrus danicus TaxID=163516 RepID=A0A7S2KN73_9STRA